MTAQVHGLRASTTMPMSWCLAAACSAPKSPRIASKYSWLPSSKAGATRGVSPRCRDPRFAFALLTRSGTRRMSARSTAASLASADRFFTAPLAVSDPELFGAIRSELQRQRDQIELIASENIVSRAVLEAQGSVLTNKYAEGYPGRRYYGGCEFVDQAEQLAIDRAKKLFGCAFANVQPHSGSQANQAVFLACLKPGDTVLGMDLAAGGHLTHGSPANISGKWFRVVSYGVRRDTALIDYDQLESVARAE